MSLFQFVNHGRDFEKTKMMLIEAANFVDKVRLLWIVLLNTFLSHIWTLIYYATLCCQYYKTLNIRVALIRLEIWNDQDKISVSDNPYSTLSAFLAWRRKQLPQLPNDNAQLVTSVSL